MFVSTGAPGRLPLVSAGVAAALVAGIAAAPLAVQQPSVTARVDSLLRRAFELDPALVESDIRLAHVLGARGELREAAWVAREALAPADWNDPWAWYYRLHEPHSMSLVAGLRSLTR